MYIQRRGKKVAYESNQNKCLAIGIIAEKFFDFN